MGLHTYLEKRVQGAEGSRVQGKTQSPVRSVSVGNLKSIQLSAIQTKNKDGLYLLPWVGGPLALCLVFT